MGKGHNEGQGHIATGVLSDSGIVFKTGEKTVHKNNNEAEYHRHLNSTAYRKVYRILKYLFIIGSLITVRYVSLYK